MYVGNVSNPEQPNVVQTPHELHGPINFQINVLPTNMSEKLFAVTCVGYKQVASGRRSGNRKVVAVGGKSKFCTNEQKYKYSLPTQYCSTRVYHTKIGSLLSPTPLS